MQFVYSAGTTASNCPIARYSPSPSPRPSTGSRTPRGWAGWRPVSPGYRNSPNDKHRTVEIKHVTENDGSLRDSIPLMSRPLAVFCLVCNICIPGLGTFLSGVTVLCCSRVRPGAGDKLGVVWVNTWVALLQFVTAFLFLLGWIWSIMWGASFLTIANEKIPEQPEIDSVATDRTDAESATHRHRMGARRSSNQPSPNQLGLPGQSAANQAPIIVLQEPPSMLPANAEDTPPLSQLRFMSNRVNGRTLNPNNPRHQRIIRRQATQEDIPVSILLHPDTLTHIVRQNFPVPRSRSDGDVPYFSDKQSSVSATPSGRGNGSVTSNNVPGTDITMPSVHNNTASSSQHYTSNSAH